MALRQLAARAGFRSWLRPFSSTAPSVFDKLVQITIVDGQGRRHVLRGVQGQPLTTVLEGHMDTLGEQTLCLSPDGRGVPEAHVKLPTELLAAFPAPAGDDARYLQEVAQRGSLDAHSRLGSKVVLSKELDGAVIALGELYPWKSL
ncbi:NADH:ubiquinone oxidoreductase 22 kDa subunit [Chlorella sorokiniana]|uniref:NADH:ubiquinone oxidoreductase 22 kDa subunit n=1 Tax=Chlorella sorokiniana TaxID=3076 RepID=A0A2P6TYB4_CHLSO|nr:NADH:ubiquinone oxidoreductase 22 kDa subunit [Chlorella sorokiniana]|eukprot:PRW59051.1 NADH:ubiquinone oxidoreductase 22 kDa subunit [Chlorella sorokiniana]